MSDRSSGIGARLLILCWLIAIIGGFFASLVMSLLAFRDGTMMSAIVLALQLPFFCFEVGSLSCGLVSSTPE